MAKLKVVGSVVGTFEMEDPGDRYFEIEFLGERLTGLSFKHDGVKHRFAHPIGRAPADSVKEYRRLMGIDSNESEQKSS